MLLPYVWHGMGIIIMTIYITFYADDGYTRYIPKRHRLNNRMAKYLAYLKAWIKGRWRSVTSIWKAWQYKRRLLHVFHQHQQDGYQHYPEGDFVAKEAVLAHQAKVRDTKCRYPSVVHCRQ